MKIYRFVFIIILPFLVSCEYDYDFGGELTPSVVVNSTITPDSTIKVYLHWSRHVDDTSNYKRVERFTAQIYEDSKIIFDGEGVNGLLSISDHPKEGSQYRLEIDVPDYGKVSAETSIPYTPKIEIEYTAEVGAYHHFNIDKVESSSTTRSVMVRSIGLFYEDRDPETASNLYANNSFCDKFNAITDMYDDVAAAGSSTAYEDYIRIPYKNLEQSIPLKFSARYYPPPIIIGYDEVFGRVIYKEDSRTLIGYDDFGYPLYEYIERKVLQIIVDVIAPSDQYDKFYKSVYFQQSQDSGGIYLGTFPIESNIENGLGSFMGYSSASRIYDIDYDDE